MDSPLLCDSGVSLSSERSGGMPYLKQSGGAPGQRAVARISFMPILGLGGPALSHLSLVTSQLDCCTWGALENHMEASIGTECSSMDI